MRRVVVTGMGIVSSLGNNVQEVVSSLREAKSGIVKAEKYTELGFRSQGLLQDQCARLVGIELLFTLRRKEDSPRGVHQGSEPMGSKS